MITRGYIRSIFSCVRSYHYNNGVRTSDFSLVYDESTLATQAQYPNAYRLITSYRDVGHASSKINPMEMGAKCTLAQLQPEYYKLNPADIVSTKHLVHFPNTEPSMSVQDLVNFLEKAYCCNISSDLSYLPTYKREWMAKELELIVDQKTTNEKKIATCKLLLESESFDLYLATKFPTLKRYGLEGAEAQLAFFMELLGYGDWKTAVIAMTHRGRLNLLTNLFKVPPSLIFHKIRGGKEMNVDYDKFTGDVLSHLMCSNSLVQPNGKTTVTVVPNPSHLELANPVSMGKTKAKQDKSDGKEIVNIQVHGDAAFSGQGVNQEMLAFSRVVNFNVNGSIHLVVNNQLGFTTPGEYGRSSRYASDLAKMIQAPVIYVNGEDPEAVLSAARIAAKYRNQMCQDIFVEMFCYRRRGHNELDDPTLTNPELYDLVRQRETTPKLYLKRLIDEGVTNELEISDCMKKYGETLSAEFSINDVVPPKQHFQQDWSEMTHPSGNLTVWDSGVAIDTLAHIGLKSVKYPDEFKINQHLLRTHVANRIKAISEGQRLDWSTAETLAIGSLLYQKFNVRFSGQDVGRGTFAHRHIALVDQTNGNIHVPLNNAFEDDMAAGKLTVVNSILSEEAVMAFEYGYSIEDPRTLVIWEAQFGDFMNGAQGIIDTYVVGGEAKWARSSSLTLLLPHGYDGAGPEHSSCRVERFLQLSNSSEATADSDQVNISMAWPSTPAQYFHLLRRQQIRPFRTPLVVVSPKTLLRLSAATSQISEFGPGTHFKNVIAEENSAATTVVFTSGKHFYTLMENRLADRKDIAFVRVESLVPFPAGDLQSAIRAYPKARNYVWSQEEPRNMGAWSFIAPRFKNLVGLILEYKGMPELPVPAYGIATQHKLSRSNIINDALKSI